MSLLFVLLALLCALSLSSLPTVTAQQSGARGLHTEISIKTEDGQVVKLYNKSYALLVGVSDYNNGWPKLPGVRADIAAVRAALEQQGFQPIIVMEPNGVQLEAAFRDFIQQYGLGVENRLLFYFAGHGHTSKQSYGEDMGYIVPVDAPNPNRDPAGFVAKALDMQSMELYARRIQSKHALFLFDSCFSGSLFALSRAVPDNIGYKTSRPVRQFITSGSADEQVPDRSIFREQFIAALTGEADANHDGYVTGSELGDFLQDRVVNYTRNAQHPQYGKIRNPNLDKGDFVFMLPKAPPPPAVAASNPTLASPTLPAPAVDPAAFELSYWNAIQSSADPEDFKDYLAKYPNGQFASIARRRMAALLSAPKPAPTSTPSNTSGNMTSAERPATRPQQMQNRSGIEFVWLPAGSFMMGSEKYGSEKPMHRVAISEGFYMGKYEVTQAQWQAVMGDSPSHFKGDNLPVETISWNDAQEFIQRLNAQNDGYTYRLPSEAEWEYAARAGTTGDFAGDLNAMAWHEVNSEDKTHPVGRKQPNAFGLFDMHGNVWEWCQDWYHDNYAGAPTDGSAWLSGGKQKSRVLRGGSWHNYADICRSADRIWVGPDFSDNILGLRVVAVART